MKLQNVQSGKKKKKKSVLSSFFTLNLLHFLGNNIWIACLLPGEPQLQQKIWAMNRRKGGSNNTYELSSPLRSPPPYMECWRRKNRIVMMWRGSWDHTVRSSEKRIHNILTVGSCFPVFCSILQIIRDARSKSWWLAEIVMPTLELCMKMSAVDIFSSVIDQQCVFELWT